jgi:hypothetical protein
MCKVLRGRSAGTLLVLVTILAMTGTVHAQCLVAVSPDDGSGPNELAQLQATLTELGCTVDVVATVAEARTAGARVLIDRFAADNFPTSDVDGWLADGFGYIQLGDWPDWFSNSFQGEPSGTPLTITVADPSHPLAAGLPATWTGRGFWAYDYTEDYLGWVTDVSTPNVIEGEYDVLEQRAVTGIDVGPGRAVYIGFNVYGTAASATDKQVLANALSWSGRLPQQETGIPSLGSSGLVVFVLLLAAAGAVLASRQH